MKAPPLAAVILTFIGLLFSASADGKPNIDVILADDMGFSDLGCYGAFLLLPT